MINSNLYIAASFIRVGNPLMARAYLYAALQMLREERGDHCGNRRKRAYIVQAIQALLPDENLFA